MRHLCTSLLLIQLLVSFHIYSNISRLSLLGRGNILPLAYFFSVALKGGMCTGGRRKSFLVYFNILIIFVYTYTFYHQIYCPIYETGN